MVVMVTAIVSWANHKKYHLSIKFHTLGPFMILNWPHLSEVCRPSNDSLIRESPREVPFTDNIGITGFIFTWISICFKLIVSKQKRQNIHFDVCTAAMCLKSTMRSVFGQNIQKIFWKYPCSLYLPFKRVRVKFQGHSIFNFKIFLKYRKAKKQKTAKNRSIF